MKVVQWLVVINLYAALAFSQGALNPAAVPKEHQAANSWVSKVAQYLAKVEWDRVDSLYGTAPLWWIDEKRMSFITNAHIIPKNRAHWPKLRLVLGVNGFVRVKAEVYRIDPGHDIAILVADRLPDDGINTKKVQKELKEIYLPHANESRSYHQSLLGTPGFISLQNQTFKNHNWAQEGETLTRWAESVEEFDRQAAKMFDPFPKFSSLLNVTKECPPLFVHLCYKVPIRSWGFSGGALLVTPKGAHYGPQWPKVAGLISHYSPLAEWTYVIPWSTVDAVARRLIANGKDKPGSYERVDRTGTFRFDSYNTVTILKGPKGGARVSRVVPRFHFGIPALSATGGGEFASAGESAGGGGEYSFGGESAGGGGEFSFGGESAGGGGEFSFGGESAGGGGEHAFGGESAGGGGEHAEGGESAGGGLVAPYREFLLDREGNISGFANFGDLFDEMKNPKQWHRRDSVIGRLFALHVALKGTDSLLGYHPGVLLEKTGPYYRYEGRLITNLPDFLTVYLENQEGLVDTEVEPFLLPSKMKIGLKRDSSEGGYGITSWGSIQKTKFVSLWKLGEHLTANKEKHPGALAPVILTQNELGAIQAYTNMANQFKEKNLDIISSRFDSTAGGSISAASFERKNGRVSLRFVAPRFGLTQATFEDKFLSLGATMYRFVGPIALQAPEYQFHSGGPVKLNAWGVVTLQKPEGSDAYELKVALAYQKPEGKKENPSPLVLDDRTLVLQGIYIPMQTTPRLPLVKMSAEQQQHLTKAIAFGEGLEATRKAAVRAKLDKELKKAEEKDFLEKARKNPANLAEIEAIDRATKAYQDKMFSSEMRKSLRRILEMRSRIEEIEKKLGLKSQPWREHKDVPKMIQENERRYDRLMALVEKLEADSTKAP